MSQHVTDVDRVVLRPALDGLVPYEPGKPVEEVQRELGLDHVVKLASNEGQFGPFPSAVEAIERATHELNRYPDGGVHRLRVALSERHDVRFEEVTVCAGADAVIGYLSYALLDPGDEIVTGWPSFTSYVLDALKLGAVPVRVPLRDHRFDLDALVDAVTQRTKIVYIATPNNPTGTTTMRAELDSYLERVPEHVLTVVDQAYFEYVDDPDYPDAIAEFAKEGRPVMVLRTFSKMYGLAGLRVGYGVGPESIVTAIGKVRRAFDVSTLAQDAALASLDDEPELARRRQVNRAAVAELVGVLEERGLEPVVPALANFAFVAVDDDAVSIADALVRHGVIVRPLGPFGDPRALRITAGTPDETAVLARALDAVLAAR